MQNLNYYINELKSIQKEFEKEFNCPDIFSSSKFFEVLVADKLGHIMIGGFSGNRDARDSIGNEYEYKHYKESSSNHTWTFNDFSDATIKKLNTVKSVVFSHLDDSGEIPIFDWCYIVPGKDVAAFLQKATQKITNKRKMINVSARQIEKNLKIQKTIIASSKKGAYCKLINKVFSITKDIEKIVGTKNILTSNKLWEILVANKLGHIVITEQTKFDAIDKQGRYYEYKVSRSHSWQFEDISDNVLMKFKEVNKIILATIDKTNFEVLDILEVDPIKTIDLLEKKLHLKKLKYESKGGLRRLQVAITLKEVKKIGGKSVFNEKL